MHTNQGEPLMQAGTRTVDSRGPTRWMAIALLALGLGCAGPSEPVRSDLVMDVASEQVDCHGFIARKCLRVSIGPEGPWVLFYDQIDGFVFEPGYDYTLRVERTKIRPMQDGSAFAWRLLEVMRKTPAVGSTP